jgi:pimeloyl-ACP methyl ester carboxylesterase
MASVTSADGTSIAYQRDGSGPAVILIGGGLDDGSENAPLARELAEHFTVYNFARRGRGDSGDTQPYAVQREIDDIAAITAQAGGSANLFGVSSGGMFALEAAAAGLPVGRLAVYEVPYDTAADALDRAREYREQLGATLAEGRRAGAVALFMRLAGSSENDIADAMDSPYWPGLKDLANTLAYDAALYGPPPKRSLGEDYAAHFGCDRRQQRILRASRGRGRGDHCACGAPSHRRTGTRRRSAGDGCCAHPIL